MNAVHSGSFLTLHYRLSGPDGRDIVSTFGARPATLSLGAGALAPALEARLIGLPDGARASFELAGDEPFGARDPARVQRVSRAALAQGDANSAVGDVLRFAAPDGSGRLAGIVRALGDGWLDVDFNHPLAGTPLRFEVQLLAVL